MKVAIKELLNKVLSAIYHNRVYTQTFSVTTSISASTGTITIQTPLPTGATRLATLLQQSPNGNWVYGTIRDITDASVNYAYRNNFGSAFSDTVSVIVFYTL